MPKLARIASIVWIVCIAAACGRQPSSPGGGSPSPPAPGSAAAPGTAPRTDPPDAAPELCGPHECGPQLGMPNRRCHDGSIGGPTGRCLRQPDGRCGWEIRQCP